MQAANIRQPIKIADLRFLSSLRLTNFRNFPEQRIQIPRDGVAIVGDNGDVFRSSRRRA